MAPVTRFFLLGPSGVGKSVVAAGLETQGFLHLDIDQHHGFNANVLRREWHQFSSRLDAQPLASTLQRRAVAAGKRGIFLSLPSTRVVSFEQVETARSRGIGTALLWGPEGLCKAARKSREEAQGRRFDAARYDRSNAEAFRVYKSPQFDSLRIAAFDSGGARLAPEDIVRAILESLANMGFQPTAAGGILSRRG